MNEIFFFDTECCDGEHICEFGYVITDANFKVIEKPQVFTINPKKSFNITDRNGRPRIELYFTEEEYRQSPEFTAFYKKIKELLEYKDQIIIGHSLENDILFLKTACERYGLALLEFDYIDSQKLYGEFANIHRQVSLEEAKNVLNLEQPECLHRSDEDAKLTMRLVEKICKEFDKSLEEMQLLFPNVRGNSHEINIMYSGNGLNEMLDALAEDEKYLADKKKSKCIKMYSKAVRSEGEIVKSELNGTSLCFSSRYEKEHIKELLIIIHRLAKYGCRYNTKVSECDYYVMVGEEIECAEENENSRYFCVTHSDDSNSIKLLTLDDLYKLIDISEKDIALMPIPKVNANRSIDTKPQKYFTTGCASTSLADLLQMKEFKFDENINTN